MSDYQLANVWYRLVAILVDFLIIFFIVLFGGEAMMKLGITNEALAVYPILFLYLFIIYKKYPSQSIGKKMMGIETVDMKTLQQPKFWQIVVRNIFRWFFVVDALFMVGQYRQRLGDMVAKTIVIKKREHI